MISFKTPVPTGTDWTLMFKLHKTSIILPVEPTETFTGIKDKLFTALTSTPNLTEINGAPLPASPDEIQLAILKKANDVESGWKSIELDNNKDGGDFSGLKHSPKGLGLKDGAILAFRFGDATGLDHWPVKIPSYDEEMEVDK